MADRVELDFRRAAKRLIPADAHVIAAVSGGGDSVALLHLLRRRVRRGRPRITVAHLDHGLRRGSAADRRFVEKLARDLELDCVADRREVDSLRRRDESPAEAARRVRRAFLLEVADADAGALVATGHTLDDQAETILMRLARGAGATALTGMSDHGPGPFVRPLLAIERVDLRSWLASRGLPWREDPSNRSLRADRNRTRRLVLPALVEALNPRAARHLVQAAARLREDAEHLDAEARRAFNACRRSSRVADLALSAQRLADLAPALAKRVALIALQSAGADPRRIGLRHIERLLDLARGDPGRQANLQGGVFARRGRSLLFLTRKRVTTSPGRNT